MLVREIMTSPPCSVHRDAPLDEALRTMAERRVTSLPVVVEDDVLVGVVSEVDVLRRAVEPDRRAHQIPPAQSPPLPESIGDIMTPDPHTTTERSDVADLISLFISSSFKSLPVVDGDRLVGVISRSDVIRALWRSDDELMQDLRDAFHNYGQDGWQIDVNRGVVEVQGTGSSRERDVAAAIAHSVLGVRRVHVTPPSEG